MEIKTGVSGQPSPPTAKPTKPFGARGLGRTSLDPRKHRSPSDPTLLELDKLGSSQRLSMRADSGVVAQKASSASVSPFTKKLSVIGGQNAAASTISSMSSNQEQSVHSRKRVNRIKHAERIAAKLLANFQLEELKEIEQVFQKHCDPITKTLSKDRFLALFKVYSHTIEELVQMHNDPFASRGDLDQNIPHVFELFDLDQTMDVSIKEFLCTLAVFYMGNFDDQIQYIFLCLVDECRGEVMRETLNDFVTALRCCYSGKQQSGAESDRAEPGEIADILYPDQDPDDVSIYIDALCLGVDLAGFQEWASLSELFAKYVGALVSMCEFVMQSFLASRQTSVLDELSKLGLGLIADAFSDSEKEESEVEFEYGIVVSESMESVTAFRRDQLVDHASGLSDPSKSVSKSFTHRSSGIRMALASTKSHITASATRVSRFGGKPPAHAPRNGSRLPSGAASPLSGGPSRKQIAAEESIDTFQILYEDLKFDRIIGSGAYSEVFKGEWLNTTVAIKRFLISSRQGDRAVREMLMSECGLMSQLRHPNVLLYMGIVSEDVSKPPCMVSEYFSGGSLSDYLEIRDFDLKRSLQIALAVARGMLYLHTRKPVILHRDLKSNNILLSPDASKIVVADFGISVPLNDEEAVMSFPGIVAGTPSIMAPELLDGQVAHSTASDVYSFGIVLWEIFTHQVAWKRMVPVQIMFRVCEGERPCMDPDECPWVRNMPGAIRNLVQKCWHQDASVRPDFASIASELSNIIVNS